MPSVKRFVNTSSSVAATFPKPGADHDFPIHESTYNDAALEQAKADETRSKGFLIYAAMKSETEKAMWAWMKENKPGFVMNCIVRTKHYLLESKTRLIYRSFPTQTLVLYYSLRTKVIHQPLTGRAKLGQANTLQRTPIALLLSGSYLSSIAHCCTSLLSSTRTLVESVFLDLPGAGIIISCSQSSGRTIRARPFRRM
jgi:hypothetical protein